jgi:hypothetical protein
MLLMLMPLRSLLLNESKLYRVVWKSANPTLFNMTCDYLETVPERSDKELYNLERDSTTT